MLAPDAHLKVYVATRPVDFRKGHDGLAAAVQEMIGKDPFGGGPQVRDGVIRLSAAQFAALFEGLDWRLVRPEQRRSPQLAG
jgi:transposase